MKIAIADIKVGSRKRKDMGDIDALADSIHLLGLLHPVVLNSERELICGGRRMAACKKLGWKEIDATVAKSIDDVTRAELAELQENTCRKDLTPSEMVAKAKVIEPLEQKAAKERQGERTDRHPEKVSEGSKGESRAKVAAAVGVSAPTLAKATAVVDAAKAHPEHYGDLIDKMDKSGKVAPVHAEMVRRHVEEKAPPPPKGPTPAEIAKADPERRWCENMHKVYVGINSIRDNGGIKKLARNWSPQGRQDYIKELRRLAIQFNDIADEIEDVQ